MLNFNGDFNIIDYIKISFLVLYDYFFGLSVWDDSKKFSFIRHPKYIPKNPIREIGSMQWNGKMPIDFPTKYHLQRSDDFDNEKLGPQWQWNYQPRNDYYSLTERPGWMRLKAYRPLENNNSCWNIDGMSQYYYSLDGDNFIEFGEPYQMSWGNYRGDRIGIYCFNEKEDAGFVDIDYLHYR